MTVRIFTDLDSLWDTRRMTLERLAKEAGKKFDWNQNFARVYKKRRYDIFDYPEFGFSEQAYWDRYHKRTKEDWVSPTHIYSIPSKLIGAIFGIVRELEFGVGKMLSVGIFELTVNTFPYTLSEDEQSALEKTIKGAIRFPIDLNLVHIPHEELVAKFYSTFQYVFKYDMFVGRDETKAFWDSYSKMLHGATKFIVPDVLGTKNTLPDSMDRTSVKELLSKMNITQGGFVTWVCIDKSYFDYAE